MGRPYTTPVIVIYFAVIWMAGSGKMVRTFLWCCHGGLQRSPFQEVQSGEIVRFDSDTALSYVQEWQEANDQQLQWIDMGLPATSGMDAITAAYEERLVGEKRKWMVNLYRCSGVNSVGLV